MKVFILIIALYCTESIAQETAIQKPRKYIYAEGLGASFIYGINFESRFKGENGIGFRFGLGGMGSFDSYHKTVQFTAFPIGINFLSGKKRHYFTYGINLIPIISNEDGNGNASNVISFDFKKGLNLFGFSGTMGYRYVPLRSGFSGQLLWSPLASFTGGFQPLWFAVGLGYSFR